MRKKGTRGRSPETRAMTDYATTISVAEETTASSAGDNRACSDGRDRKDECGGYERTGAGCGNSY